EKSGKAFFPSTMLNGRRALRVNVNSYLTEQRHIDDLVELLVDEGRQLTSWGELMTNDEIERAIEFLVKQQGQFSSDMQRLEQNVGTVERSLGTAVNILSELTK